MQGYDRVPDRSDTDVLWARIGAVIIDTVVVAVLTVVVATVFFGGLLASVPPGPPGPPDPGAVAGGFSAVAFVPFAIAIGYYLFLEGLWDGHTVGKKVLGIKVVKKNGDQIGLGEPVVRNLLRIVDGLFYYAVGFVFIVTSDRRQRLGDRVAGTVVVREPKKRPSGGEIGRNKSDRGDRGERDDRQDPEDEWEWVGERDEDRRNG